MALEFKDDDARKMRELQAELAIVLRRANDRKLEAAVAAFALVRLARQLLDKYPAKARKDLLMVVTAFLEHRDLEAEDTGSGLLIM